MRVQVLGASRVTGADGPSDLGARKPRSILAALALRLDTAVSADTLVDLVWGDDAPKGAHGTLHSYISGLRRTLEPGLAPRQRPQVLLTVDGGYRLHLPRTAVDAAWFADEVRRRHRALAPLASQLTTGPQPDWPAVEAVAEHAETLELLLGSWTGTAYADLPDHPDVLAERAALEELRATAEDDLALALLALGDHATVVAFTEQATARHPLRERTRALHALALTRAGRQADALSALRDVRTLLADELGLDPGSELRDLEQAVLRQDAGLQQWLRAHPAPTTTPTPSPPRTPAPARRSLVGRDPERETLREVLTEAAAGTPAYAVLVGEAGIGKSRLLDDLVDAARVQGFVAAVGRCSSDDGAPALWPWRAVLAALAPEGEPPVDVTDLAGRLGGDGAAADSAAFATWELLGDEVRRRTDDAPVLLVLDDLHWADAPTLRAVSALVSASVPGQRLAVVVSRRPWPAPVGALAELEETLHRRHARWLEPAGLDPDAAAALVASVAEEDPDAEVVQAWHERSGGNPFFLVELARLWRAGGASGRTRAAAYDVPTSVQQVIVRRLEQVPEETRELLLLAAVLGREFSLDVLAAVAGLDAEEGDDRLTPARASGIVRDREAGVLAFDHALTRDAVIGAVTPTRLARLHARVAHALDADPGVAALLHPGERVSELARHWLAAGPAHVGRAWPAAMVAAREAQAAADHQSAIRLFGAALDAHRRDPAGLRTDRYDLLLERAAAAQRGADWQTVLDSAYEAIALARADGDPVRVARAAAETTRHSVWNLHEHGQTVPDAIDDLRWALAHVGEAEPAARAVLMLSLAQELYYDTSALAELEALADEGLRIARAQPDPQLRWWAALCACITLWRPVHLQRRLSMAEEALAAADETPASHAGPDEQGRLDRRAIALTVRAGTLLDVGDVVGYERHAREAEAIARSRQLAYVLVALGFVEVCLESLRERPDRAAQRAEDMRQRARWTAVPAQDVHDLGLVILQSLWQPERVSELSDLLWQLGDRGRVKTLLETSLMAAARSGHHERVREMCESLRLAEVYADWPGDWGAVLTYAALAEAAAAIGDVAVARVARAGLAPSAGGMTTAGIAVVLGPVDGYLALAESVLGHRQLAADLADRADSQAREHGFTAYAAWLAGRRAALGI